MCSIQNKIQILHKNWQPSSIQNHIRLDGVKPIFSLLIIRSINWSNLNSHSSMPRFLIPPVNFYSGLYRETFIPNSQKYNWSYLNSLHPILFSQYYSWRFNQGSPWIWNTSHSHSITLTSIYSITKMKNKTVIQFKNLLG